jgi:CBS-domain-containing membrane protein
VSTLVRDVMTRRVISVRRDAPFTVIAAALRQYRVSAFPVLDEEDRVIGVVSEADLLAKLALEGGDVQVPAMSDGILHQQQLEKARGTSAADLMTALPVTVSPDDTVEQAARLMYLRRVKHLPVVGAGNHLAGILSRADVLAVFSRDDNDIRQEALAAAELSAAPAGAVEVAVRDGIVTLTGATPTGETAREIARRVRHVEGVVAVRDRLRYPPPGKAGLDTLAGNGVSVPPYPG